MNVWLYDGKFLIPCPIANINYSDAIRLNLELDKQSHKLFPHKKNIYFNPITYKTISASGIIN
jgi:hypothetical protein